MLKNRQSPDILKEKVKNIRTLPICQHFSSDFQSFNMADLAQKYSDSGDFSTFSFKIFGLPIFQLFFFKLFGFCRFFNIFLQIPYLLTWQIWRKNIWTQPIFQHFSADFLSYFHVKKIGILKEKDEKSAEPEYFEGKR